MRKNVWMINHYATNMYENCAGRHYSFAKYLLEAGYRPIIFCSSFEHKTDRNYIINDDKYIIQEKNGIIFVFIKTSAYIGNGKQRVFNMLEFTKGVVVNGQRISMEVGKPDVILGSSVHPLSCVAGIILSKKFKVKSISEIRDLWPETLVMFGAIKENSFFTKLLYKGEKWIYSKSDDVIFTMEGGKQYVIDRGWDKDVDIKKLHYINNGIDLELFDKWKEEYKVQDVGLDCDCFKVIYTGAIAKANGVERLIKAAQYLKENGHTEIKILIYGGGEDKDKLEKYCIDNNIENVVFKGWVEKKCVPYILTRGSLLLVNYSESLINNKHNVLRYGGSHNKLFEYLASAKPILYCQPGNYNLVEKYKCGKVLNELNDVKELAEGIVYFSKINERDYDIMCKNSRQGAQEFEFRYLTQKLIDVIERDYERKY